MNGLTARAGNKASKVLKPTTSILCNEKLKGDDTYDADKGDETQWLDRIFIIC